jgi:hypothetical protein
MRRWRRIFHSPCVTFHHGKEVNDGGCRSNVVNQSASGEFFPAMIPLNPLFALSERTKRWMPLYIEVIFGIVEL